MDQPLPWASWDRSQLGSLKTRLDREQAITPEDLAVILEGDEACVPDPLLREYLLRALRGKLGRPRGRPKGGLPGYLLEIADGMIEQEAEHIRLERASEAGKRRRGDREPKALAADRIVWMFGNITGDALRNLISSMKNPKNDVRE